ncbi:MAG: hypothetical protein HEEMFOPI_00545 [Holosporales bacterium]
MDILFLILLTAVLFYRLWSVLGAKTGFEKQRPFVQPEVKDNIILMPKRNNEESTNEEDDLPAYQKNRLSKVFDVDPNFDGVTFLENAQSAYELIIDMFTFGDIEILKKYVSSDLLEVFQKAIDERDAQELKQETEILKFLLVEIDKADVLTINDEITLIQISVLFKTKQICVVYNNLGEIIENPAKIANTQQDIWTFKRELNSKSPTWKLIKTKTAI